MWPFLIHKLNLLAVPHLAGISIYSRILGNLDASLPPFLPPASPPLAPPHAHALKMPKEAVVHNGDTSLMLILDKSGLPGSISGL